jgi:O-antigen/teichoic acid export membrane protein
MPRLGRNIAANFIGKAATAAVGLLFPPIIARLLGIESYGLIGIYSSLTGALAVLDLGLTATLTREMARLSDGSNEEAAKAMKDMVRTFELVFWSVGIGVGGLVFLAAPLAASHWVHARTLEPEAITASIRLMGLVICLQWPSGMYNGGLLGLQRQVSASAIQAAGTTLRFAGGAAVLWKVSDSLHAFFIWQGVVAGAQTVVTAIVLGGALPRACQRGAFRWRVLLANWRYSVGASVITLLAMVLLQADKIIVSKLLPLAAFGYYTLAWTVGSALGLLVTPVFVAVFPRLTQLARQDDTRELAELYHTSCQLVSVVLFPAAAVLTLFSREVIWAWTGDAVTVAAVAPVVIPVAIGTTLNGLMNMPHALQLAYGWTRLAVWSTGVAVVVIVPLTVVLAKAYGTVGAATGWAVLNAGFMIFNAQAMHRRLLRSEQRQWYLGDVGLPFLGTLLAVVPIRALVMHTTGRWGTLMQLGAAAAVAMAGAGLASPALRKRGIEGVKPLLSKLGS